MELTDEIIQFGNKYAGWLRYHGNYNLPESVDQADLAHDFFVTILDCSDDMDIGLAITKAKSRLKDTLRSRKYRYVYFEKRGGPVEKKRVIQVKDLANNHRVGINWVSHRNLNWLYKELNEKYYETEDQGIDAACLDNLLESLSQREKDIMIMYHIEGRSQQEISEEYDLDRSMVSRILIGALAILKERISGDL